MPDAQTYTTIVIGATVTISVAVIGNVITIVNSALARKNEHKLAILKVLLEAAYKEYEFRTKQDLETGKLNGQQPKIKSFTEYVIFYKGLATLFAKSKISEEDLILSLKNNKVLIDAYYKNKEIYKPEFHLEPKKKNVRRNLLQELISVFKK